MKIKVVPGGCSISENPDSQHPSGGDRAGGTVPSAPKSMSLSAGVVDITKDEEQGESHVASPYAQWLCDLGKLP